MYNFSNVERMNFSVYGPPIQSTTTLTSLPPISRHMPLQPVSRPPGSHKAYCTYPILSNPRMPIGLSIHLQNIASTVEYRTMTNSHHSGLPLLLQHLKKFSLLLLRSCVIQLLLLAKESTAAATARTAFIYRCERSTTSEPSIFE
jgi:hypothetical protein